MRRPGCLVIIFQNRAESQDYIDIFPSCGHSRCCQLGLCQDFNSECCSLFSSILPLPQASSHILGSEERGRTRSQTRRMSEKEDETTPTKPSVKRASTMTQTAKVLFLHVPLSGSILLIFPRPTHSPFLLLLYLLLLHWGQISINCTYAVLVYTSTACLSYIYEVPSTLQI